MKSILSLLIGFFLLFPCIAQEKKIETDSLLLKLQRKLKNEWDLKIINDTLIIESKNFIWIDFYHEVTNLPTGDSSYYKYTPEYIQKNGRKTKMLIRFSIQSKWDSIKIKKTIAKNEKIMTESNDLVYKYKLSHLRLTHIDKDGTLLNATKEENDRLKKYKEKKSSLSQKIKEIPIYNSEKYSLSIIYKTWNYVNRMLPMIYPKSEQATIDNLENTINSVLKNYR